MDTTAKSARWHYLWNPTVSRRDTEREICWLLLFDTSIDWFINLTLHDHMQAKYWYRGIEWVPCPLLPHVINIIGVIVVCNMILLVEWGEKPVKSHFQGFRRKWIAHPIEITMNKVQEMELACHFAAFFAWFQRSSLRGASTEIYRSFTFIGFLFCVLFFG